MLEEYGSSYEHGGTGNFCVKLTLKRQQKFWVWLWLLLVKEHLSYAFERHSKCLTWIREPGNTAFFVDILGICRQTLKKQQRRQKMEKA